MTKTRLFGVAAVLGGVALLGAGCSKNEAASNACASMAGSSACSTCCTQNGASGYKYSSGSPCQCLGGDKAAGPTAPASGVSFAGSYRSTWGQMVFTQTGNQIQGTYTRGTITCVATGNVADCDWREGRDFGKARLVKEASGAINGTWGKGASASDGGAWNFTP